MRLNRLSSLLAPIRIRYLLLVALILGLIFFALAYMGIRSARQSLLKIMVDEGKALVESLTLSSNNAIQAGLLLESLADEKFADLAHVVDQRLHGITDSEIFRQFRDEHNLLSIDILDSNLTIVGSDRWASGFAPRYPPEVAAEIHDIQLMGGGYRSVTVYGDSLQPLIQYFVYAFAPEGDLVVMATEAAYLEQITRRIGIGYLIRRISDQAGIDYIILQSRDGIIFASQPVAPVLTIENDPFLGSLMETDTVGWRIHEFEGREVLEITKRFESVEYPPGVYRIGIDLDEYREISKGYNTQIITIAIVLFLLTLLLVAVVSINQNYFILDQSYRRMRSMTETIFDRFSGAVLAFDSEDKIIAVNKAFTELCDIDSSAIGRRVTDIAGKLPFELPAGVKPGERAIGLERNITTSSGEQKTVLLGVSSLPSGAGGGAVILIHDITDQKRLEEESRRRERLSEMGDMAAGVAHEIRNPLNAISIAAQRLKHEFEPTEEKNDYDHLAKNILDESARLNDILTRFLELTKTRAAEYEPIDLAEPIKKAIESVSDEASRHNVSIDYPTHDEIKIRGAVEKMQQVFINLLKNSIQAMPGGGNVIIAVNTTEDKTVEIMISDTGPGFPPEVLPKIFQPYFTTKADGSGLGLALAYKTVTDYGGRISAFNSPAAGAVIKITLPVV